MSESVITSLSIRLGNAEIFAASEDGMVLLPTEESERATVFLALTDALALLAGVRLPQSIDAKASGEGRHSQQSPQCRGDALKSGDVVHLRERRGSRNEGTSP